MTNERKKAIIAIASTLVIGILIGVLATGMVARQHYHGRSKKDKKETNDRMGFIQKIYRITDVDSAQAKVIRPIIEQTMIRIDTIQREAEGEVKLVLDSMIVNLRPHVNEKQLGKLEKFAQGKMKREGYRKKHR